jgi:PAS domain-containing protein
MDNPARAALDALPRALVIVDEHHSIQFINSAAVKLFEIPDSQNILGRPFSAFPGGTGLMTFEQRLVDQAHINEFAIE